MTVSVTICTCLYMILALMYELFILNDVCSIYQITCNLLIAYACVTMTGAVRVQGWDS